MRDKLLAAVVMTGVVGCLVAGCAKKSGQEAVPEIHDTLSATSDMLSKIPNTLTDSRDGKTYKTVKIGKQVWMAENLNHATSSGSWCYSNKNSYCDKYGRLYDWNTAMNGASSSSANPSKLQGVCPKDWHLPSRAEWDVLSDLAGESKQVNWISGSDTFYYWPGAGTKLKSTSGWYDWDGNNSGNGTDDVGFSALPGGYRSSDGSVGSVGSVGSWWTATENASGYAYYRLMYYDIDGLGEGSNDKENGFSVRCVRDAENDERLASTTNGADGDSKEARQLWRVLDSLVEMGFIKQRKWLEERFHSVAKDTGYGGQTSGKNTESYPDEINCVIDSVIHGFSQWEEFKYRPDSPIMDLLCFTSDDPIRPISFRQFKLGSGRSCIWVEIWKMRSSADARRIDNFRDSNDTRWEMELGSYSPKSSFVFKEYFILLNGCSYQVDRRIFGIDKYIRKRCFDCGTIDGESPDRIGDKYSCYSDKVIFGQNGKDW